MSRVTGQIGLYRFPTKEDYIYSWKNREENSFIESTLELCELYARKLAAYDEINRMEQDDGR